jgi:hypothetical protein
MAAKTRSRRNINYRTRKLRADKEKYVICMPGGGLCDMMARIQTCIKYCEKHNRTLILDTSKSTHAKDGLEKYVRIDSPVLFYGNVQKKYEALKGRSFYPPELAQTFLTMNVIYRKKKGIHAYTDVIDKKTRIPTYFNTENPYSEDVLLYRMHGGNFEKVVKFLSVCTLTPLVKQIYTKRRSLLPEEYISVHVRNTDYKSDVDEFLNKHSKVFETNPIFLATDDYDTIQKFKQLYGSQVKSFAKIKPLDGAKALHTRKMTLKENRTLTIDAIVDLLLLAGGKTIFASSKESGYSKVAKLLHDTPKILNHLLE